MLADWNFSGVPRHSDATAGAWILEFSFNHCHVRCEAILPGPCPALRPRAVVRKSLPRHSVCDATAGA